MGIHILCIGTELLVGECTNSNLTFLGGQLCAVGLEVTQEWALPDDRTLMRQAMATALANSELVICSGGLGPTDDDMTREIAAEALGVEMVLHEATADYIRGLYAKRNLHNREARIRRQSLLPVGSELIKNDWGTAPGSWCRAKNGSVLVLLPGVPREMKPMFTTYVLPRVQKEFPPKLQRRTFSIFGHPESTVEERTLKAIAGIPEVEPAYSVKTEAGKCDVRLTAKISELGALQRACDNLATEFGPDLFPAGTELADLIAQSLRHHGWQLATAESCTGGWIGMQLTDISGISSVYRGGIIAYSNDLKKQLLGVPAELLDAHGAVSAECAEAMARGVCPRLGATVGLSVTGIAGPGGGTPEKPVGTVFIGTVVNGQSRVTQHKFPFDRLGVRGRTVTAALNQLRSHLLTAGA
jgi:nicotinamide-nucleotide amidase